MLGNHDNWESAPESGPRSTRPGIDRIDNRGVWSSAAARPAADLRRRRPLDRRARPGPALGDATDDDAVILLSHNPDFAETVPDPRVGLMLSGHTHGGQVVVPGYGAPIVPSTFGQKYLDGLVARPALPGLRHPRRRHRQPARSLLCRPEVVLITLV